MKPILFNTEMVRAILDGRKTVTRRVVKYSVADVYDAACFFGNWHESFDYDDPPKHLVKWYVKTRTIFPYTKGDILYVREAWTKDVRRYIYKSDYTESEKFYRNGRDVKIRWQPSINMPKEAARIFLRVKEVRQERLQDITGAQAVAEGVEPEALSSVGEDFAIGMFHDIWDSTIKPADLDRYGWGANPWVWVTEFERISKEEALA